ncbi:hypothetical protein PMI12_04308, partial [Variovorax sp. CF313]
MSTRSSCRSRGRSGCAHADGV